MVVGRAGNADIQIRLALITCLHSIHEQDEACRKRFKEISTFEKFTKLKAFEPPNIQTA